MKFKKKKKEKTGNLEKRENFFRLKRLDRYIISKFLGTFFFSMGLIMAIVVVFDFNEKLDKFMNYDASTHEILFHYYLNFIPYFGVRFSPLFIFISVIYFTSKMASDTEIIAILASGVSFRRLIRPYMMAAGFLAAMTFVLNSFWIPVANKTRLAFEDKYVKKITSDFTRHIQMEVEPGVIMYIDRFEKSSNTGYDFFLEKYDGKMLVSRLTANRIHEDSTYQWSLSEYMIRNFDGLRESITKGSTLDTCLKVKPEEFFIVKGWSEQLTTPELKRYLDRQEQRGVANIKEYSVEYSRRFSFPFSAFILTLIGVSLASRKVRGGMGLHLGLGIAISFAYIMFDTISGSFAEGGALSPTLAVWLPNLLFFIVGLYLYFKAPK
ncbi:MAG TPA: LptF/LptG family permease [Bacteroidales bacterium]|nr:LptF/LptG family permease [Bacteroidales bacterium]